MFLSEIIPKDLTKLWLLWNRKTTLGPTQQWGNKVLGAKFKETFTHKLVDVKLQPLRVSASLNFVLCLSRAFSWCLWVKNVSLILRQKQDTAADGRKHWTEWLCTYNISWEFLFEKFLHLYTFICHKDWFWKI